MAIGSENTLGLPFCVLSEEAFQSVRDTEKQTLRRLRLSAKLRGRFVQHQLGTDENTKLPNHGQGD